MSHPLYTSRAGRILYRELPEALRLYDNRDPSAGTLGDLEAFMFGFGHMLERFDATLIQLYADGLLDPAGPAGNEAEIQGWLLPYVAQLFGVELVAPDPDSRQRELAGSIWVARRRGTRVAVDTAAEMITGLPVVVVAGARRVLRTPSLAGRPMTHREAAGLWHPGDAAILQEPVPTPEDPATHVTGFLARQGAAHDGLPVGAPDPRRMMRAVEGGLERPEAETRPRSGAGDASDLAPFVVRRRRGRPCFPDSYEDRSMRAPDMRAPRQGRPRFTQLKKVDAVTLFVRPPQGIFTGAETWVAAPTIADGRLTGNGVPERAAQSDVFYDDPDAIVDLNAANADSAGRHVIEGLKFAGTVRVMRGRDVVFRDCAIGRVTGPAVAGGAGSRVSAHNCIFDEIDVTTLTAAETETTLEYVTVTGSAALQVAKVSDSIMAGVFTSAGDGTEKPGCVRYSLVPPGFDRTHVHWFRSVEGVPRFLVWPCITREGTLFRDALPEIGEPGYGVLSDRTAQGVAMGAEDGGEMGVHHGYWHLARLRAAERKAAGYLPVGQSVFAIYDTRLLADLPAFAE
ncbi:hypothetical protein [Rhodovulum sulfidophilum]|uniref:hypothetical protein n=1 Tax=Rhodovulum sulfidophilum TaxID=35806 RepID=UPI000952F817|nr:hypothetical protein [Rhodovulum sulfidophilum]OLS52121.1 hypothetical protein BV392_09025 [Rhodovulum sulfidophilum]